MAPARYFWAMRSQLQLSFACAFLVHVASIEQEPCAKMPIKGVCDTSQVVTTGNILLQSRKTVHFSLGQTKVSSSLRMFSVETRDTNTVIPVPGVMGWTFENIGIGEHWERWISKVAVPARFFEQEAKNDPDEIVVLADTADVLAGGCNGNELLRRYHATVAAHGPNGPKVIFGAQFRVFPRETLKFNVYPKLARRRDNVLAGLGLNRTTFLPFLRETRCRKDFYDLCRWPRAYDKLNAGFVMGPIGELHRVFTGALAQPKNKTHAISMSNRSNMVWNDQLAFAVYMSEHPDQVGLDYGGLLSAQLVYSENMIHVENGVVKSRVHGSTQCFVHGNGNGCFEWQQTLSLIDPHGASSSRPCHSREVPAVFRDALRKSQAQQKRQYQMNNSV